VRGRARSVEAGDCGGYYGLLERPSITDIKDGVSAAIDLVRHGDAIVIEDGGVPVARLEPVLSPGRPGPDGRAARLVHQGVLMPAAAPPARARPTRAEGPSQLEPGRARRAADRTMKFWDRSALAPLLAAEPVSKAILALYTQDPEAVVWWSTPVECASAIDRLERDESLSAGREGFVLPPLPAD
jgi:antitoxin (DNA-binding transcriptional repressor) of toxin-antitoxin stability system